MHFVTLHPRQRETERVCTRVNWNPGTPGTNPVPVLTATIHIVSVCRICTNDSRFSVTPGSNPQSASGTASAVGLALQREPHATRRSRYLLAGLSQGLLQTGKSGYDSATVNNGCNSPTRRPRLQVLGYRGLRVGYWGIFFLCFSFPLQRHWCLRESVLRRRRVLGVWAWSTRPVLCIGVVGSSTF